MSTPTQAVPRPGLRILAYLFASLVGVLWILGGVLLYVNQPIVYGNDWFLWGLFTLTGIAYVAAAVAIVHRQPSNPIGWLFFLIAGSLAASIVMTEYGVYAIQAPGALPAPGLVLSLAEPTPALALLGIVLVLQLFPDGHPVTPRWRLVIWLTLAAIVFGALGGYVKPHRVLDIWSDMLSHAHVSAVDPLSVQSLRAEGNVAQNASALLSVAVSILAVISLFVRRGRADATQRDQLRWLAYVVGVAMAWILIVFPLAVLTGANGPLMAVFWLVVTPLVALGIPIAVGIAIVRHRLFDIDVVISKTIVYGALGAFITIVYAAIVVGIGQLIGSVGTPALSAVAAAVVALAFQPVRRRVQRVANRFVYGDRATPYEALSEFSDRVAESYSTEDVLPRMAQIVARATGVSKTGVWLRLGSELRQEAAWPSNEAEGRRINVQGDDLPWFGAGASAFPVRHQGDLLGAIVVEAPASDPMTPDKAKLITDLASQAGLVLRNVRLIEELRASRQRIVTAQDERARALERNIHDGAQQQLVALAVRLRLARSMSEKDPAKAGEMLDALQAEASDALENLRDLARGIYPQLLADQGLAVALEAQARKSPVPVIVESDGLGRYVPEVEAAIYFCTLEALQNVGKYAKASRVNVRLSASNGAVRFSVEDNGAGFDPSRTGYGTGLQGMSDRLEALGGELQVHSESGAGTTVKGRLPIGDGAPENRTGSEQPPMVDHVDEGPGQSHAIALEQDFS